MIVRIVALRIFGRLDVESLLAELGCGHPPTVDEFLDDVHNFELPLLGLLNIAGLDVLCLLIHNAENFRIIGT